MAQEVTRLGQKITHHIASRHKRSADTGGDNDDQEWRTLNTVRELCGVYGIDLPFETNGELDRRWNWKDDQWRAFEAHAHRTGIAMLSQTSWGARSTAITRDDTKVHFDSHFVPPVLPPGDDLVRIAEQQTARELTVARERQRGQEASEQWGGTSVTSAQHMLEVKMVHADPVLVMYWDAAIHQELLGNKAGLCTNPSISLIVNKQQRQRPSGDRCHWCNGLIIRRDTEADRVCTECGRASFDGFSSVPMHLDEDSKWWTSKVESSYLPDDVVDNALTRDVYESLAVCQHDARLLAIAQQQLQRYNVKEETEEQPQAQTRHNSNNDNPTQVTFDHGHMYETGKKRSLVPTERQSNNQPPKKRRRTSSAATAESEVPAPPPLQPQNKKKRVPKNTRTSARERSKKASGEYDPTGYFIKGYIFLRCRADECVVPVGVLDEVRAHCRQRGPPEEVVNYRKCRKILRYLGQSKCYPLVHRIVYELNGQKPPDIDDEFLTRAKLIFSHMFGIFTNIKGRRSSMINYDLTRHMTAYALDRPDLCKYFPIIKTAKSFEMSWNLWLQIAEVLNLKSYDVKSCPITM